MGEREDFDVWWRIGLVTVGSLYRLSFRMRFDGLARLPDGPGILAANHVSVLDPVAIALATSAAGRPIRFVAAAEFFDRPIWGLGLRLTHQIPIRRGQRDIAALTELQGVVHRGGLAGIFPEGRVSMGERPLKGHSGVSRVALATGVPIVPVGVWGAQARWPRGRMRFSWPWRLPLGVSFGDPIAVDPAAATDRALLKATTHEVMRAIERLVDRARDVALG